MAHAIDMTNGRANFAFTGERSKIWHGLGNTIADDASIEEWQQAAGLDFRVLRSKVRYETDRSGAAPRVIDDQHVLFRSDSKAHLGIVSDQYKVVQPAAVLEFFRDLVHAAGFKVTTAGSLHGGRKVWAQADVGAVDSVVPRDFVGARLLLATSFDGSMQTVAKGVSERVVCANTLGFAMSERGGSIVKVSHRSVFDADKVKRQLGVAVDQFTRFMAQCRELAHREVSPVEAEAFVAALFGADADATQAQAQRVVESAGYQKVLALFRGEGKGSTLPGVRGTAWGLVNGCTEYTDWWQRARSQDNKFDSAMFGAGDDFKQAAFYRALALLA